MSNEPGNESPSETATPPDTLDPAAQREYRERVIELAFAGDPQRFSDFLSG